MVNGLHINIHFVPVTATGAKPRGWWQWKNAAALRRINDVGTARASADRDRSAPGPGRLTQSRQALWLYLPTSCTATM